MPSLPSHTRGKCKRKKIHAIHKANIMKLSDGLFIRCSRNISKDYPEITYGEHIVDNTCMQLVMNPYQYDVLLLENLYGDIVSDLCAAFVGGLGLVPGANFGHECAIFEAVHGSAPDIAGKDIANPTAVLRSGVLMLRHLGEENAANHIRAAIEKVYSEKKHSRATSAALPAPASLPTPWSRRCTPFRRRKPVLQEVEL